MACSVKIIWGVLCAAGQIFYSSLGTNQLGFWMPAIIGLGTVPVRCVRDWKHAQEHILGLFRDALFVAGLFYLFVYVWDVARMTRVFSPQNRLVRRRLLPDCQTTDVCSTLECVVLNGA